MCSNPQSTAKLYYFEKVFTSTDDSYSQINYIKNNFNSVYRAYKRRAELIQRETQVTEGAKEATQDIDTLEEEEDT